MIQIDFRFHITPPTGWVLFYMVYYFGASAAAERYHFGWNINYSNVIVHTDIKYNEVTKSLKTKQNKWHADIEFQFLILSFYHPKLFLIKIMCLCVFNQSRHDLNSCGCIYNGKSYCKKAFVLMILYLKNPIINGVLKTLPNVILSPTS